MIDKEFGIWMMENMELAIPLEAELRAAGRLLPEANDENIALNAQVLVEEFKIRYKEQIQKGEALGASEPESRMAVSLPTGSGKSKAN
jgi:hypothetical protein